MQNVHEVGYWFTTCYSWLNLYSVTRKVLNLLLLSYDLMTALMQDVRMLDWSWLKLFQKLN